jgi:hypothetical protein
MAMTRASATRLARGLWEKTALAILLEHPGMERRAEEKFDMAFVLRNGLAVGLVLVLLCEVNKAYGIRLTSGNALAVSRW